MLLAVGGRFPDAIEHFTAAVRDEPNYAAARLQLADAFMRTRRPDLALPHYARAVELDPRSPQSQLGYALALANLGRVQEARVKLREGMAAHPERPEFAQALDRLQAVAPENPVRR